MFPTRLKIAVGLLLIIGAIGLGAGFIIDRTQAAPVHESPKADKPETPKADKPEHPLAGTWAYVSIEGRVVDRKPSTLIFEGERDLQTFEIGKDGTGKMIQQTRGADGKVSKTGTFDITVEAEKNPPRLTLQTTNPDKYKIRYIYEVNKDTLKLCSYSLAAVDGVELVAWPTGFDLDKQDLTKIPRLDVFKRVSPK